MAAARLVVSTEAIAPAEGNGGGEACKKKAAKRETERDAGREGEGEREREGGRENYCFLSSSSNADSLSSKPIRARPYTRRGM